MNKSEKLAQVAPDDGSCTFCGSIPTTSVDLCRDCRENAHVPMPDSSPEQGQCVCGKPIFLDYSQMQDVVPSWRHSGSRLILCCGEGSAATPVSPVEDASEEASPIHSPMGKAVTRGWTIERESLEKRVKNFLFGEWLNTSTEYDEIQAISDFVEKQGGPRCPKCQQFYCKKSSMRKVPGDTIRYKDSGWIGAINCLSCGYTGKTEEFFG